MTRALLSVFVLVITVSISHAADKDGWVSLMDGKTFKGWKASENKDSWSVEDGAFVAKGPRSHLFYVGDDEPFVNFELEVEVMTKPNSNGGIYFHTKYQEEGWPSQGFEAQVNNTYKKDPRKTGSLYGIVDVRKAPAKDNVWYKEYVKVEGKRVVIKIDGKTVVDYTEPKDAKKKLGKGTFALQAHDPGSTVYFRKIRVKRLE